MNAEGCQYDVQEMEGHQGEGQGVREHHQVGPHHAGDSYFTAYVSRKQVSASFAEAAKDQVVVPLTMEE